jgi:hypothetical protein
MMRGAKLREDDRQGEEIPNVIREGANEKTNRG